MGICPECKQDKALIYYDKLKRYYCFDCRHNIQEKEIELQVEENSSRDVEELGLFGQVYYKPKPELLCNVCNKSVDKVIMTVETEHDPQKQSPFNYNFKTVYQCQNCLLTWLGLNNINNGNKSQES